MKTFTQEEKDLIINTPITIEVFDINKLNRSATVEDLNRAIKTLEQRRLWLQKSKKKNIEFKFFVGLLPTAYKVVNLIDKK